MKRDIQTSVAIIGGGLAGLYAARRIHALGIGFQLFEARDRLGGRILSANDMGQSSNDSFDLGPSWFWPEMQRGMAALVEELGLATFPQHSDGDVVVEKSSREEPRRYQGIPQEPPSMRVAGGTGALITALSDALPLEVLRLGMRVSHATLTSSDVLLTIVAPGGSAQEVAAEQVIFALPPGLLASSVAFTPDIESAPHVAGATRRHGWRPMRSFFLRSTRSHFGAKRGCLERLKAWWALLSKYMMPPRPQACRPSLAFLASARISEQYWEKWLSRKRALHSSLDCLDRKPAALAPRSSRTGLQILSLRQQTTVHRVGIQNPQKRPG